MYTGAHKRRAAEFAKRRGKRFLGHRCVLSGLCRKIGGHVRTKAAVGSVGNGDLRHLPGTKDCRQCDGTLAFTRCAARGGVGGKSFGFLLIGLPANAVHGAVIRAIAAGKIAVGKAVARKESFQICLFSGTCRAVLGHKRFPNARGTCHIGRRLKAAFDFQRGNAQFSKKRHVCGKRQILQAERIGVFRLFARKAVRQTAGLGAKAAVAATFADDGAHQTQARMADA